MSDARDTEIERLRARITELEAEIAILRGTLSRYDEPDEPLVVLEYPPNAPR